VDRLAAQAAVNNVSVRPTTTTATLSATFTFTLEALTSRDLARGRRAGSADTHAGAARVDGGKGTPGAGAAPANI